MPLQEQMAGAITRFAGSMLFVYLHLIIFGVWIAVNLQWLPLTEAFDPSLVILAMVASVEHIFISTFVLISQNRMAEQDDKRADRSLQLSLLNEHETTRLIAMVSAIVAKLDFDVDLPSQEIQELQKEVRPGNVLDRLEQQKTK